MAAYNRENWIAEAMESILRQDERDVELIVADDGSADATVDVVAALARSDSRVVLLRQAHTGAAAARNLALSRVRGEYTAIMDSDDISLPERLRSQAAFLDAHPSIDGVGSYYYFMDAAGNKTGPRRYEYAPDEPPIPLPTEAAEIRRSLFRRGIRAFLHSTAMFRTRRLQEIGGYRTIFPSNEDVDVHLRLLTAGKELANLPEMLFLYRQSDSNLSAASLSLLLHRVAAIAAAHWRLAGLNDPIDARREPIDYAFLMELMAPVNMALWLEWIGLLQYHKCDEPGMLAEAWRHVLAMPADPEMAGELSRHWRAFAAGWPEDAKSV